MKGFDNFTMYIASHRKFEPPSIAGYLPIQVGVALCNENYGYLSDGEGENISKKNKSYCELTALYWIWKNSGSKIIGLCHYRRYFSKYRLNPSPRFYLSEEQADRILSVYDIIVPEYFYWRNYTVGSAYYLAGAGFAKDLKLLYDVMNELFPEYIQDYEFVLNSHKAFYCNMFVCKKELLDSYCQWLFQILFTLESRISLKNYSDSQKRVFGYLSEILLNVYIRHHNLNIFQMPAVVCGREYKRKKILLLIEKVPLLSRLTIIENYKG